MKPVLVLLHGLLIFIAWFFIVADMDSTQKELTFELESHEGNHGCILRDRSCFLSIYPLTPMNEIIITKGKDTTPYVHITCLDPEADCLDPVALSECIKTGECSDLTPEDREQWNVTDYTGESYLSFYPLYDILCEDVGATNCVQACDDYGLRSEQRSDVILSKYDDSETLGPFCWGKSPEDGQPVASCTLRGGGCMEYRPCDRVTATLITSAGDVSTVTYKVVWSEDVDDDD